MRPHDAFVLCDRTVLCEKMFIKRETWERLTGQPKGTQYVDIFQHYHKDLSAVPNT